MSAVTMPARADELDQAARELVTGYAAKIDALATWCDEQHLAAEARKTRAWLQPRDPSRLYVFQLSQTAGGPEPPAGAPVNVVEWNTRFARLRREQSGELFDLARRAVRKHRASLAFDLVLAALRENPDNQPVRRLLGYQKYRGEWHTAYEVQKLRAGQVWHEKFGWLPKTYVRRYEEGQRYHDGRWITAEEDARAHRDILSGWDIETEHYNIRTNHSIEAGAELATKLEGLYRVWKQLFVRYFATEAQVLAMFDGRSRSRRFQLPRHQVVYFRDREDYNRSLRAAFPNIGISIGVYVERTRRAYFFAGEDSDRRTLFHEATHQLFHESRPVAANVGGRGNFWIVEGIAMYMESLRQQDGYYVLGGFDDARMLAARYRLLKDNFYVPLAELTTYGVEKIQTDQRIATLYSQAAGLAHFLIHYDGGRYRDALVAYLATVYSGRDNPATLSQLTGTSYAELDRQYRQFMEAGPQPAAAEAQGLLDCLHVRRQ